MPMSPSDLPWWGWLLIAAVAYVVNRVGMLITNACRLDEPTPVKWYIALVAGGLGIWTAIVTAAIGIARMPPFMMRAVLAGLLVLLTWATIENSKDRDRSENELKEKLKGILDKLNEH